VIITNWCARVISEEDNIQPTVKFHITNTWNYSVSTSIFI